MNQNLDPSKEIELSIQNRDFDSALKLCDKYKSNISNKEYFYLTSVCHRYLSDTKEALLGLDKLIQIDPNYGRAYQEIGHNNVVLKNKDKALKAYLRAVRHNPSLQSSWLGILSLENSNEELIKFAEKNVFYLKDLPPELKTVLSFTHEGKLVRADHICREYLRDHPHDIEAMRLLANIGSDLNIYEDAEFLLESALLFDPDNPKIKYDYINILTKRQKYGEALKHAQLFYDENPSNINAMKLLSTALFRTDRYKEAIKIYNDILNLEPKNTDVMLSMGHLYKTSGEFNKSISSYKKAYYTDKYFGDAYWSLANLKTYKFTENDIKDIKSLLKNEDLKIEDYFHLLFALGKAQEDNEQYEESIAAYIKGNTLKSKQVPWDSRKFSKECDELIDFFTEDFLSNNINTGDLNTDPIFIVGLPRSGSTLLEQILSSHSLVEGTTELQNIIALSRKIANKKNSQSKSEYPSSLAKTEKEEFQKMGAAYIKNTLDQRVTDKPYFIDKMPNNFIHIGLIKTILPNAKIIDTRRDPMDTCFSCFKQFFARGQLFTYSMEDLGNYYTDYIRAMNHWHKVYGKDIFTVHYDDVINKTEETIRELIDYCNLPFEQECLEFYKSSRPVKTPSAEQVRQPIYKSGLNYWKNYEKHLLPLKEIINEIKRK